MGGASASPSFTAMAYATDQELLGWEPEILEYLPSSQSDYSPQHNEAKRTIVHDLIQLSVICEEDQIYDPEQLKTAAIFKALEIIFNFLSANDADKFFAKSEMYRDRYNAELQEVRRVLTVDLNSDGAISSAEESVDSSGTLERW